MSALPIPEPSSPLWHAVKAVSDLWPLDLEEDATALANAWRQGGATMYQGATQSANAGTAAYGSWNDHTGGAFTTTVTHNAATIGDLQPEMEMVAARGDAYATELIGAKTDIVTTIAANEGLYALLGNPLFGALGVALRQQLVAAIAGNLQNMIEARAAALRSGTAGTAPAAEPPPPPAPAPDDGGFWSDLGHTALDLIGLVPVIGEPADALNAGWYAAEGDWVNAGLSLAAMVPMAGWLATGGKLGYKATNAALRVQPVTGPSAAWAFVKNRPPEVPLRAQPGEFKPSKRFPTGVKYTWTDPKLGQVTYHGHGLDTKRFRDAVRKGEDVGNAARGPVYRFGVEDGYHKGYADANGNSYALDDVKGDIANLTHIPANRSYPAPEETHIRVALPNPVALGPNDPGSGEDR